jgi:hypothetical protein
MRVYYRSVDVMVSEERFVWLTAPPRVFGIRALHDITIRSTRRGLFRPRRWELVTVEHGAEVLIFASRDERVFNQVVRALRRAVEHAGTGRGGD